MMHGQKNIKNTEWVNEAATYFIYPVVLLKNINKGKDANLQCPVSYTGKEST